MCLVYVSSQYVSAIYKRIYSAKRDKPLNFKFLTNQKLELNKFQAADYQLHIADETSPPEHTVRRRFCSTVLLSTIIIVLLSNSYYEYCQFYP